MTPQVPAMALSMRTIAEIVAEIHRAQALREVNMDRDEHCYLTGIGLALGWVLGLTDVLPHVSGKEEMLKEIREAKI